MNTDTDTGPGMGLRESKKHETRQLISDHATRLFMERGFEATTIADIAAASRVAKKTVTNYFARKEDLALDHQDEFVGGLAHTVSTRAEGESALAALRRAFLDGVERQDPVIGFAGARFTRMLADSPTLTARLRDLHDRREEALTRALADTTGAHSDDLLPRAAAVQLGGAERLLFRRITELTLAGSDNDRIAATVTADAHTVYGLLAGALGDYAIK
ncbi:TetR/AcrR family transcriptional regulator [Streptomyces sp. SID3343]|uniref:TetR/AcrR family transcriptional regulator n=1 Tax=Streptomyces sp. SID3343 TaxID=2690260 RepID=UPI001368C63F|nr:TetR/AcrR family transcriptional regulator [Streptomyces sp. SID3343]MYV97472.1 TetR family transcriptional regulator [Streptomyces sp. SID3343]